MNVLILSDLSAGGHASAAKAIKASLEKKHPDANVHIEETLHNEFPLLEQLWKKILLPEITHFPNSYGKAYEKNDIKDYHKDTREKKIAKLLSNKLLKFINTQNPDVIVCPHPTIIQMASILRSKGKLNVPVVGVVTDFVNHNAWLNKGLDSLIVPHESIAKSIVEKNKPNLNTFPEGVLKPYGIPIAPSFGEVKTPAEMSQFRKENGLVGDKKTVLLMGGSLGLGKIEETFKALIESKSDIQIIAVAGKNKDLKAKLDKIQKNSKSSQNIKVTGVVDNSVVQNFMRTADVIISKPGGLTSAEAMTIGRPLAIISSIPGHETRNTNFFVSHKAAIKLENPSDIKPVLDLLNDPKRLQEMKANALKLGKPKASEMIADEVWKLGNLNKEINKNKETQVKDTQVKETQALDTKVKDVKHNTILRKGINSKKSGFTLEM